ncbi:MAG: aspartokinase [Bacteroidetes bacterium]|nr:aspartokinase [Bacteroidota bacterium]
MKFGGTSVGTAQRIKNVAKLISNQERKIVVLSAMSGTTSSLIDFSNYLNKKNTDGAVEVINILENKYMSHIQELFSSEPYIKKSEELLNSIFSYLRQFTREIFTSTQEKIILSQGEILSSSLMQLYLEENNIKSLLLSALDFMRIDKNKEPDTRYIQNKFSEIIDSNPNYDIYLTQGFICRNAYGEIDNLERGGSDYTASILGGAILAEEIQIWTDIDGMHNNDPRFVEGTTPVRNLNFDEAAELAYFGAKILHPTCILPAKINNIPVRLLNTMEPEAQGTIISNKLEKGKIKAVAAKDNITSIKIKSGRMLLAFGFLRKVFEIFESYQTPIDMITTSEVGVALTIDNNKHLNEIVDDLKQYGTVTFEKDMCIICVVGDLEWNNIGFESKIIEALKDIPISMISYGGSNYNLSILLSSENKINALRALSKNLFN